jgi:hypothetical protein
VVTVPVTVRPVVPNVVATTPPPTIDRLALAGARNAEQAALAALAQAEIPS